MYNLMQTILRTLAMWMILLRIRKWRSRCRI